MAGQADEYDDLFFRSTVRSYVSHDKNPRFLRRDWLADEVLTRLEKPDCRFVMLTAEPGAGKSTFMAQLAHDYPKWPRYFIRRDQRQPLANAGARSFLMRIGFQLAETYPDFFPRDDIVLDVDQEIGRVEEKGAVLGVSIKKLVASPFYQRIMVKVKQTVEQTGGSIRGIQIDTVIADARLLSLNDLQELALFDPARRFQARYPRCKIVVLVDALDELRYHDAKDNILWWLTGCPIGDLPANVRFVLTSRPSHEALRLFYDTQEPNVETIALELDEEEKETPSEIHVYLEADARTYADQLVTLAALEPYWTQVSKEPAAFAADAATKAEGNLGYLDAIGRALDQAIDQNDEATVQALLSLRELPRELEGLYAFFLSQVQERVNKLSVKLRDPATGKAVYVGVWEDVCLPILGVLSVALAPLTTEQIHDLGQIDVSLPVTSSHLDRLRNFLDSVGDGYRLYHSSFAEFLAAPRTAETAPGLYCDPTEWHGCVADHYREHYTGRWPDCDLYGLRHLPTHLRKAKGWPGLTMLLTDFDFMETKCSRLPVYELEADYRATLADWGGEAVDREVLEAIEERLRRESHHIHRAPELLFPQLYNHLTWLDAPDGPLHTLCERVRGKRTGWLRMVQNPRPAPSPWSFSLEGHTGSVMSVAVTPDGEQVISGSDDKTVKVWELGTGRLVRSLADHGHSDNGGGDAGRAAGRLRVWRQYGEGVGAGDGRFPRVVWQRFGHSQPGPFPRWSLVGLRGRGGSGVDL